MSSNTLGVLIGACVITAVFIAKVVGTKLLSNLVLIVVVLWAVGKAAMALGIGSKKTS